MHPTEDQTSTPPTTGPRQHAAGRGAVALHVRARRAVGVCISLLAALWLAACASRGAPAPTFTPPAPAGPSPAAAPIPTPAGPITITFWDEDSNEAGVLLDALAAEFMLLNPDVTVIRRHYGYDELRNQFRAAAFSGQAPALVRAPGEFAGPFGELRIVKPLDALFAPEYLDLFLPGALDGAAVLGRLWGIPDNFGNHLMLIYNKALVSAAPASTDSWIAELRGLTDAANGQYGLVYPDTESYWLIPWLTGFGSWPLDAQGRVTLDTAEMIEALWFAYDLKYVHGVMPATHVTYQSAFDLFSQGRAAYTIDGAWNFTRYQGLGLDLGVAALPKVSQTGLAAAPMATGRYWFIAEDAAGAELDAAARFVEFMTSAEVQQRWLADLARLPSLKNAGIEAQAAGDPLLAGSLAQLRVARGAPPALEMGCAWQGLAAYLGEVMAGQISPDEAAPQMQAEADACVADMGGYLTPTP